MIFPVRNDSEALRRELRVSQAVSRVRQLPTVFLANPLLAAFVAMVYWEQANRTVLIVFVSSMAVLWTPAVLSWRRLRNRARPARVSAGNERRDDLLVEFGDVKERAQGKDERGRASRTRKDEVANLLRRACLHRWFAPRPTA